MSLWEEVTQFLSEPSTWSGPTSIWVRLNEHVWISVGSTAVAILLVLPLGLWLGHTRRGATAATAVVNVGRAIPSFGILVLSVILFVDLGVSVLSPWPAAVALVLLAAPPIFTNTITAIQGVPAPTVEAARGMGFTEREVLSGVEVPLAMPVILEGVRIAFVQVIATATLWAITAGGGLGRFIVDGFAKQNQGELIVGAVLVAGLAVLAEFGLGFAEKKLRPGGAAASS